jgi:hypothetical protein
MMSRILIFAGMVGAAALMVVALRVWQLAPHIAFDADRPEIVVYAVRTAAVAVAALAQTVLVVLVLGNIYRTRTSDVILRLLAVTVLMVSLVSAIALSLAARN